MPVAGVNSTFPPVICSGDSVILSSNSTAGSGTLIKYQWYQDGLILPGATSTTYIARQAAYYTLEVTNSNNCVNKSPVKVITSSTSPVGVIDPPAKYDFCEGNSITLTASPAASYQWQVNGTPIPGATNNNYTVSATGTYTVMLYNSVGCKSLAANPVTLMVHKVPTIEIGPDKNVSPGMTVQLAPTVTNGPISKWVWDPAENLSCNNCPLPIATIKDNIRYTVKVTNNKGCTATDAIAFKVFCEGSQVFIPNLFTPDNNGRNDVFMVRASGIKLVKSFRIFNRWGELIFERQSFQPNDKSNGWNGTIKGVKASPDVFVYTCEVVCENEQSMSYKGNVAIIK
jgi:gliding motility-associated-like protein